MMMEQREVERMILRLILREGGYVDHPRDAGGCTNHGITRATLERHRGRPTTCADVRDLGMNEAVEIYERHWFDHSRLRLRQWPYRRLAEVTLDAAVMFALGRSLAVRWAQEAINEAARGKLVEADGWAGPKTLHAMTLCQEGQLVAGVVARRCRKHARVVAASPGQAVFLPGWIDRATAWTMGTVAL